MKSFTYPLMRDIRIEYVLMWGKLSGSDAWNGRIGSCMNIIQRVRMNLHEPEDFDSCCYVVIPNGHLISASLRGGFATKQSHIIPYR